MRLQQMPKVHWIITKCNKTGSLFHTQWRWYLYFYSLLCCAGPFWICTTLVFTIAVAGNLANYFHDAGEHYKWKYDFHKGLSVCCAYRRVVLYVFCVWKSEHLCMQVMHRWQNCSCDTYLFASCFSIYCNSENNDRNARLLMRLLFSAVADVFDV